MNATRAPGSLSGRRRARGARAILLCATAQLLLVLTVLALPWESPHSAVAKRSACASVENPTPAEAPLRSLVRDALPGSAPVEAVAERVAVAAAPEDDLEEEEPFACGSLSVPPATASPFRHRGPTQADSERGRGFDTSIAAGLEWLRDHQSGDGRWKSAGFQSRCGREGRSGRCAATERTGSDVAATALALLAFMGDGHTTREGAYKGSVSLGIRWLREQQLGAANGADDGLIVGLESWTRHYDHALAALALCEAYYFSGKHPLIKPPAQAAVDFIARERAGIRDVTGGDASVLGWSLLALTAAREAGLTVEVELFTAALAFLDARTDSATGRVSLQAGDRDVGPTAVALLCRLTLDQDPATTPIMGKQAHLLRNSPPTRSGGADAWFFGSFGTFLYGGEPWKVWRRFMEADVVPAQREELCERGSWDPAGEGDAGGRVQATALRVMCLQTYYRYGKVQRPR